MTAPAATPERRPLAVVTGASGGIGLELARILAADGHDVALVARSAERLAAEAEELSRRHGIAAHVFAADLAPAGAADDLVRELSRAGLEPEVLVNNAGFGLRGAFAGSDPDTLDDMIRLNVLALTRLTRLVLPGMLERGRGRVLNVASTAAFQPGPGMAVYYATKAYVLSFSEALAVELAGSGVTVTTLCPGPTATGFAAAAGLESSHLFRVGNVMTAREVARQGYAGMRQGRRVIVTGARNRLLAFGTRLAPRRMSAGIAGFLNRG